MKIPNLMNIEGSAPHAPNPIILTPSPTHQHPYPKTPTTINEKNEDEIKEITLGEKLADLCTGSYPVNNYDKGFAGNIQAFKIPANIWVTSQCLCGHFNECNHPSNLII